MRRIVWMVVIVTAFAVTMILGGCAGLAMPTSQAQDTEASEAAPAPPPANQTIGDLSTISTMVIDRGITEVGRECIDCHKNETPGIVNDWKDSRHGHVSVSCLDCHQVDKN